MVWDHPDHGEPYTGPGSWSVLPRSGEHSDLIDQLEFDIITLDEAAMARYVADIHGLVPEALTLLGLSPVSVARQRPWNATVAGCSEPACRQPRITRTAEGWSQPART